MDQTLSQETSPDFPLPPSALEQQQHRPAQEFQYQSYIYEQPPIASTSADGPVVPPAPVTYHQQLAQQYYQSQDASLPPSSHLPAQFQASVPPSISGSHQQQQIPPQIPIPAKADPSTSQRILMWQNAISSVTSDQQPVQRPSSSIHQSEPHYQYSSHQASLPATTQLEHSPVTYLGQRPPLNDSTEVDKSRPRTLTIPSSTTSQPPPHADAASIAPSSFASDKSQFQFNHPPPVTTLSSHVLHFSPPPPATASIALSQPSQGSTSFQAGHAERPMTIDLNPSANLARQRGVYLTEGTPHHQRIQSSTSSSTGLHRPLQGYLLDHHQHQQQEEEPQIHQPSPQAFRPSRTADWVNTAVPATSTPARGDVHARFQSASNVRGAPTEAFDGSPAKISWDPHGRFTTMDSIASSQWSPTVNDMYRLVDPLRSNFDFSAALEQTNISSPNQVTQQLATGPRIRRVSSLTSGAPTFGAFSEPVQPNSNPNSNMAQSPAKASRTRGPSSQSQQQLPTGFTPIYTYPVQQHSQQQSLQPTQPAPQLQPQPLAYQAYDSQVQSGADDDDRRASTSTSLSSVPLISPEDLHRGEVGHQIPSAMSYMPMEGSVKSFLQDGGNPYAYRDYCNDPYDPSPPSASQPLPYVDYQDAKPADPIGSDLSLVSGVGVPPSAHHLRQWTSASVELPIAQLDLREDPSSATKVKGEEGKRKRAISKNLSVSTIPQTLTAKPQMTQRSHSANETLAPTQDRAYRRLSSPVLSVRPNDTGDAHTFSDDDDDEEEEEEEKPSVIFTAEQSRRGSQGILYSSYPTPGFATMPSASTSASASTVPSVYASVPVTSSSSSGSTTHTPAADNQPVHPAPPPADTSHLVRAVPPDVEDSELGRPRRQKLRFGDDWYTPEWVRGDGAKKEGFCDLCQPGKWLQLKNSAFWYHRQYTHGISSVSGQPFTTAVSFRQAENDGSTEALCHQCNEWVVYTSRKQNAAEEPGLRVPTNWFKHAHKCHFYVANRSKNDKPRGKRRKVSSSPDDN